MKNLLIILFFLFIFSCTKEEYKNDKNEIININKDTTENEIEIDINIKCYGSN